MAANRVSQTDTASALPRGTLRHWIEQRTGLDSIVRIALDEPIPGGARWMYIFGSGLLFLFVSQILTGVVLALYYVPAANDAHVTVAYIVKVVSGGSFLRSLHSYGASALIIVLLLHILQTMLYGAYKGRRELVWLSGCALFALMLGMAFTGYLLPWDQKAYFATAVGTNVMGEVPVVGNFLKQLLRGGNQMGTVTLSRFFVLHVFVLPGLLVAFIVSHVYLFRRIGPAGPAAEESVNAKLPTEPFYPEQFFRDFVFAVLLAAALAALAYFFPVRLGPEANAADTAFLPRPEWYFLPVFEWLKFWPGRSALVGVVLLPGIVTTLFVALPFLDRSLKRHPLERPLVIGGFILVLGGMVGFGVLSHFQDRRDPVVSAQMARQERATEAFMAAPFAPLTTGNATAHPAGTASNVPVAPVPAVAALPNSAATPSAPPGKPPATPSNAKEIAPAPTPAKTDPLAAQGQTLYTSYMCNGCHGDHGEGTDMAPPLAGLRMPWTVGQISSFLQNPDATAAGLGMPAIPADSADLQQLVAFIRSLPQTTKPAPDAPQPPAAPKN